MENKIKILIADDHPLFSQGLAYVLNRVEKYYLIGQAKNGEEVLTLIDEHQPDVAVLDVQMPKKDGFEVAKYILREKLPTKIVFLTMFKEKEFVKKIFEMGIKGYVLKENAVTEIVNCIESVMQDEIYISPQVSKVLLNKEKQKTYKPDEKLTPAQSKF